VDIVLAVLAVVVLVALAARLLRRRQRQDPGIDGFRRHIDALSPEARREVMDRVRPPADDDDGAR